MEVASFPRYERRVGRAFKRDAIDDFRELTDHISESIAVRNHSTIQQTAIEIKAQFDSMRRGDTPATLQKNPTFGVKHDLSIRRKRRFLSEQALDKMHCVWMTGSRAMVS